jgi:predicted DNA-binding transcriptional regulator AlpA
MSVSNIRKVDSSRERPSRNIAGNHPRAESAARPQEKFGVQSSEGPTGSLRLTRNGAMSRTTQSAESQLEYGAESMPRLLAIEYVTPEQLAAELGISVRTLHRWHTARQGQGPPRVVLGRVVIYRRSSVLAWIESREERLTRRVRR